MPPGDLSYNRHRDRTAISTVFGVWRAVAGTSTSYSGWRFAALKREVNSWLEAPNSKWAPQRLEEQRFLKQLTVYRQFRSVSHFWQRLFIASVALLGHTAGFTRGVKLCAQLCIRPDSVKTKEKLVFPKIYVHCRR